MKPNRATLSILIPIGEEPPKEVRLFARGENPTSKGTFLFDDTAAREVMAMFAARGKDIMLDLEHLSLDTESKSFDPDARGWASLDVRNGELWLTDISWNEDGVRRIEKKTQRYLSPVFDFDPKTKRVLSVFNVAITANPATHNPMPLVAAADRGVDMKPAICKMLNMPEDTADEEVLKALAARLADAMPADMPPEEKKDFPALRAIALAARKHTGKSAPAEVEAVLVALSASRTSLTEMTARLATLEADNRTTRLREMCRANPKKVANEKLEKLVMDCPSIEAAQALVDALPEIPGASPKKQNENPGEAEVTLTDADREACKLTGQSPAKILEYKKKQAALRAV